jgi:hypothetical protein
MIADLDRVSFSPANAKHGHIRIAAESTHNFTFITLSLASLVAEFYTRLFAL